MSEDIKLYHGDCLELMRDISDNTVDLTVTSPPYDNLRTYNGNIEQWNFAKFEAIARELYRVTKEGGVVVWIVADATIKGSETGTSFKQALYFKDCGFNLHDTMIWEKPTCTDTGSLKVRYGGCFEYMFVFCKGKIKTFNPIKDRKNKTAGQKKSGNIRQKDGSLKPMSSIGKVRGEYSQRFNIWECKTVGGIERIGHPAQFPEQLAQDHIISWSNAGDVVLDTFMGSGTTGVACVNTGRRFVGMEIDKQYFDIASERIETAQKAVAV